MVTLNRAQLAAIVKLAKSTDIEQLMLLEAAGDAVVVTMTDLEDNTLTLTLDEWGQGRLHNNGS